MEALELVELHLPAALTIHDEALVKLELIVAHSRQVLPPQVRYDQSPLSRQVLSAIQSLPRAKIHFHHPAVHPFGIALIEVDRLELVPLALDLNLIHRHTALA